jgi:hypothetical protein
MVKQATKAKKPVKNERSYIKTVIFKYEPTYEERESIIKRTIYIEQEQYKNKPFRFIVVEKTMELAKIKFFVKQRINEKK